MRITIILFVLFSVMLVSCSSAPKPAVIEEPKELTVAETLARTERQIQQFKEMKEDHQTRIRQNLALVEGAKKALSEEAFNEYVEKIIKENENHLQRIEELEQQIKEHKDYAAKLRAEL